MEEEPESGSESERDTQTEMSAVALSSLSAPSSPIASHEEGPSRTTSLRSVLATQAEKVSSPDSGLVNVGHYIEMRKDGGGKPLPRAMSHDSFMGVGGLTMNKGNVNYNEMRQNLSEKGLSIENKEGGDDERIDDQEPLDFSADYTRERNRLQKLQLAKAAMNNYLHRLTKEWPTPVPDFIIDAAKIKIRTMASNHYSPGDAPFKKGWLKFAKRRWWFPDFYSQQYVILDEDSLSFYTSPQHTSQPPNMKISLSTVLRSEPLTALGTVESDTIELKNFRIGFELHTSDKTEYVLLTDTQESVSEWVCAIELCVVFDVCNKFCQEVVRSSPHLGADPDAIANMLNPVKVEEEESEEGEDNEDKKEKEEEEEVIVAEVTEVATNANNQKEEVERTKSQDTITITI